MFSGLMSRWTTPGVVSGGERVGDLYDEVECFWRGQPALREHLTQGFTFDEFTGNEAHAVCFAHFIGGDDMRMI